MTNQRSQMFILIAKGKKGILRPCSCGKKQLFAINVFNIPDISKQTTTNHTNKQPTNTNKQTLNNRTNNQTTNHTNNQPMQTTKQPTNANKQPTRHQLLYEQPTNANNN